jgi:hypothetical protein
MSRTRCTAARSAISPRRPEQSEALYRDKLLTEFDQGNAYWKEVLPYYDDNWAWFGIALYTGNLPNLTANLPQSAFER